MATNALLCRWADGWREVIRQTSIDAIGRREAFLSLGAISTTDEVDRVANMQLDVVANPRTAIATDLAPMNESDRPYRAFNVGDTITVPDYGTGTISQRVRALTGAEDDNGEITYSPELGDLILEEQERTLQAVKKMSDGTLEGDSPVAQPRLRTQVQRIWAPPSMPGGLAFTITATATDSGASSSSTWPGPDTFTTYTLTSFTAVPLGDGAVDGETPTVALWQYVPGGDGNNQIAEIELPINYSTGVTYTATLGSTTMNAGGEWAIGFRKSGTFLGDVRLIATFEGPGGTIDLGWST